MGCFLREEAVDLAKDTKALPDGTKSTIIARPGTGKGKFEEDQGFSEDENC